MALRPGQLDHTARGLAEIPEKLRGNRIQRYLSVYLRQFDDVEELIWRVLDGLVNWRTTGAQLDFVLEIIGAFLDQSRPDGYDNEQYTFLLQARVLARKSKATRDDVIAVAQFLARGNPVYVFAVAPKILIVTFVGLVLTPEDTALYESVLLQAIDAIDQLEMQTVTSATAFYDVGEYDEELYAP